MGAKMSYPQYAQQHAGEPPLWAPYYGAPFPAAVQRFLKKYTVFHGRASRSEYWWWMLVSMGVALILQVLIVSGISTSIYGTVTTGPGFVIGSILAVIWFLGTIVPSLALLSRRLHDANFSAWLILIALVPFVGGTALIVMTCLPSNPAGQRFDQPDSLPGAGYPPVPGGYQAYPAPSAPAGQAPAGYGPASADMQAGSADGWSAPGGQPAPAGAGSFDVRLLIVGVLAVAGIVLVSFAVQWLSFLPGILQLILWTAAGLTAIWQAARRRAGTDPVKLAEAEKWNPAVITRNTVALVRHELETFRAPRPSVQTTNAAPAPPVQPSAAPSGRYPDVDVS
jgi:uncharacterized membrane protein YhaH (DUF805 family)